MSDFDEVEFERVPSEDASGDVEMSDIVDSNILENAHHNRSPGPNRDVAMALHSPIELHPSIEQDPEEPKFVIAIDFGTTFSSVAFVRLESNNMAIKIGSESIKCIDNFPDMPPSISADVLTSHQTVPTELMCYRQQSKLSTIDSVSDHESQCSMDSEWASSSPEDSDLEKEKDTTAHGATKNKLGDSIWGWGVHSRLVKAESIPEHLIHLTKFKLLLDETPGSKERQKKSAQDLKSLAPAKVVDIIAEYLGKLLKHTKTRLQAFHGLHENSPVEFVMCVPTSWTDRACRIMQDALTTAIKTSKLAKLPQGIVEDLFIVAESEAAATYALEDHESQFRMTTDESFLLLDCGGGTVDAITYQLTRTTPARMKEVVTPDGVSCGSSLLNDRYENLLKDRLKQARIVGNDSPLQRIVAVEVQKFESEKRSINILDKKARIDPVHISGLQADPELGIRRSYLDIRWKDLYNVFNVPLRGVADLMLKQLNAAKASKVNVQTVILTGGFGESPSLRKHLKKKLVDQKNLLGQSIDLHQSRFVQSAVARGAVLRALNKEHGPRRFTRSSYGILQSEAYDEENPLHRKFRVTKHPADGELYIMGTIHWVIEKVFWRNAQQVKASSSTFSNSD